MCDLRDRGADEDEGTPLGINEFVDELVVAITNSRIYWHGHPRVASSIATLVDGLESRCTGLGRDRIEVGAADGYLFFETRPLLGASLSAPRLLQPLAALRSGGIAFGRGAGIQDFLPLVELLGARKLAPTSVVDANLHLEQEGCRRIQFLPPLQTTAGREAREVRDVAPALLGSGDGGLGRLGALLVDVPVRLYQGLVDVLQDVMVRVCRGDAFDTAEARGLIEGILGRLNQDARSMMRMARYEQYDAFTFGHSIRVCFLALDFARTLTRDTDTLHRIGLAALLHDVGKSRVPFDILHARGRLTDEQRAEMARHTIHGGEILLEMPGSDPLSVATAFGHHQAHGRQGYPRTPHEPRHSLATRLIKICDVYEALTAVRPYKPRMSPTRAYRIMMSMEGHFESWLLRRFIEANGIYPVGSRVRLSTGDVASVRAQTTSPLHPVVQIEALDGGRLLGDRDVLEIDLSLHLQLRGERVEVASLIEEGDPLLS